MWRFAVAILWAILQGTTPASGAESGSLARIVIDGRFDDWAGVPVAFSDPAGDQGRSTTDILSVRLANDDAYLYLSVEFSDVINLQNVATPLRIYFDTDRSATTGQKVGGIGSDLALLFPERRAVEQSADAFEAGAVPPASLGLLWEPTLASKRFEMRLSRKAVFPKRGGQIFAGDGFDILLAGGSPQGETVEWAPDGPKAYTYRFARGTLPPWPTIPLAKGNPRQVRLLDWNMEWDSLFLRPEYFDRILRAVQPDVICFQEVRRMNEHVRQRLDAILPLPDGGKWTVHKNGFSVLASRWPISRANFSTSFPTGSGEAMALIDLPDDRYGSDLYVISAHYKCCGQMNSSEDRQRQIQSDATVRWFRDLREPGGDITLTPGTPFVLCGDLNLVGNPQVLNTLVTGKVVNQGMYGPDSPPDWDGSPLTDLCPLHIGAPLAYTWRDDTKGFAPGRLDAIVYTDSVMRATKSFVLNTAEMGDADLAAAGLQRDDTAKASDHLPLVADFELAAPGANRPASQPAAPALSPR